eukprot:364287-Chlamydomonas_euryale.AAC.2
MPGDRIWPPAWLHPRDSRDAGSSLAAAMQPALLHSFGGPPAARCSASARPFAQFGSPDAARFPKAAPWPDGNLLPSSCATALVFALTRQPSNSLLFSSHATTERKRFPGQPCDSRAAARCSAPMLQPAHLAHRAVLPVMICDCRLVLLLPRKVGATPTGAARAAATAPTAAALITAATAPTAAALIAAATAAAAAPVAAVTYPLHGGQLCCVHASVAPWPKPHDCLGCQLRRRQRCVSGFARLHQRSTVLRISGGGGVKGRGEGRAAVLLELRGCWWQVGRSGMVGGRGGQQSLGRGISCAGEGPCHSSGRMVAPIYRYASRCRVAGSSVQAAR